MSLLDEINEFKAALDGIKGELDAWLEVHNEDECKTAINGLIYASLNAKFDPLSPAWCASVDAELAETEGEDSAIVTSFGIRPERIALLLKHSGKPEEISGEPGVQHSRVTEIISWMARLTEGNANPKWLREHAYELAYYIASNSINRHIDMHKATQDAFQQGVNISAEDRALLQRLVPDKFPPAAPVVAAPGTSAQAIVWPKTCDGKEQEAWEAYGQGAKLDMSRHPMFYIFLSQEADAARHAWKAGLEYAAKTIREQMDFVTLQSAPVAQLSEPPDVVLVSRKVIEQTLHCLNTPYQADLRLVLRDLHSALAAPTTPKE